MTNTGDPAYAQAFCMSSSVPLRIVAILSNVLFALYGLSAHLYSVICSILFCFR
jgi:hypothetical protein